MTIEREDVLDLLALLVGRSLVVAEEGVGGETRYRLLETIREYAREKLAESGEEAAVRRHHRDWFLAFAESFSPSTYSFAARPGAGRVSGEGGLLRALVKVKQEADNLRAALDFSRGGDNLRARAFQEEAVGLARETGNPSLIARSQHYLGYLLFGLGQTAEARRLVEEALAIAREVRDPQMEMLSLLVLGAILHRLGADEEARPYLESCRDLARREGSDMRFAEAEALLARVALAEGDVEGAERMLERNLQVARSHYASRFVADGLHFLGDVARARGDLDGARARYLEGLRIHHEVGDLTGIAAGCSGPRGRSRRGAASSRRSIFSARSTTGTGSRRAVSTAGSTPGASATSRQYERRSGRTSSLAYSPRDRR